MVIAPGEAFVQANFRALGVAAFDARLQSPHALARDLIMGMDGERCTERVECCARLVELFIDEAKPGKRAEMARLTLQRFLDGCDGAGIIVRAIGDIGPPIPGLGEIRRKITHLSD